MAFRLATLKHKGGAHLIVVLMVESELCGCVIRNLVNSLANAIESRPSIMLLHVIEGSLSPADDALAAIEPVQLPWRVTIPTQAMAHDAKLGACR